MKILVRMMLCLMISFTLVEIPIMKSQAYAGMISTTEAVADMSRADADKTMSQFLDRGDVKAQLVKMGVSPEEAGRRLAGLSDKEAKKLSTDIQTATLGGDIGGILILVLVIVLIIYLVKRI
ncbi:MAG TPA: PA2779 family protein [Bacteriovoracaceae bacterium]|nr:PA2779 family protein [Bacteriovoracaceae bacterium]